MNDVSPRTRKIEDHLDRQVAGAIALHSAPGNMITIAPQSMAELFEFAKLMSVSGECIPKIFRERPGACLAIALQAFRTGADPFAVANKSYMVNDRIAYEAQYIHATLNTSGQLKKRLRPSYTGSGVNRRCKIVGEIVGEDEPFEYESPEVGRIVVQNSPLWKSEPDQQLFYYASRAWARRHLPEVILGMDTGGDIEERGQMRDVTPPPRPRPEEFQPEEPGELYDVTDCDGGAFRYAGADAEDALLEIFAEAERRGLKAIEACVDNNEEVVEQLGSVDVTYEFAQLQHALTASGRTCGAHGVVDCPRCKNPKPAEVADPEPKRSEAHIEADDEPRSSSETKAGPTSGGRGDSRRDGTLPPSDYAVPPVYDKSGAIVYRAWWAGAFLNRVRTSKTREDVDFYRAGNGEMIQGYFKTLSPGGVIAAKKELDDIQKSLPEPG